MPLGQFKFRQLQLNTSQDRVVIRRRKEMNVMQTDYFTRCVWKRGYPTAERNKSQADRLFC